MKPDLIDGVISVIGMDADREKNGDYIGDDGLLYCCNCNTPKQTRRTFPLGIGERTMFCVCKCQQERYEALEAERKNERERQIVNDLRKASLIDAKSERSTFCSFKLTKNNERAYRAATRYVETFDHMVEVNQGLLFYGEPGTGKTFIAACIANALIEQRIPVMMTSFVKLISEIQNQSYSSEGEESAIWRMNKAKLLIIDDLGAERSTDYALERVYNVVDSRYRSAKPMILTTNLTIGQMQSTSDTRYSRIYDRIFEMCFPVEVKGGSWRCSEAARRFDEMSKLFD